MELTETEIETIAKMVLAEIKKQKPKKPSNEQLEKETLEKFEKMGYKVIKPFTKVLPIRKGKRKGEMVEHFGYVMKRDRNVFAKVFTTQKRDKLEIVWA